MSNLLSAPIFFSDGAIYLSSMCQCLAFFDFLGYFFCICQADAILHQVGHKPWCSHAHEQQGGRVHTKVARNAPERDEFCKRKAVVDGYKVFRKKKQERKSGRVVLYAKKTNNPIPTVQKCLWRTSVHMSRAYGWKLETKLTKETSWLISTTDYLIKEMMLMRSLMSAGTASSPGDLLLVKPCHWTALCFLCTLA